MKKFIFSCFAIFFAFLQLGADYSRKVKISDPVTLLKKVEHAENPEHMDNIRSLIQVGSCTYDFKAHSYNAEAYCITRYEPMQVLIGSFDHEKSFIYAYTGKVGWGIKTVRKPFDYKKSDMKDTRLSLLIEKNGIRGFFKKFELEEYYEKVNGKYCYKLTCTPPLEYKLPKFTYWIDKDTFYVIKIRKYCLRNGVIYKEVHTYSDR